MATADAAHRGWALLSNHGKVLVCLARDPAMRVSDIAAHVGIRERAVQRILADLRADGLILSWRVGRRNHYSVNRAQVAPWLGVPLGKLLDAIGA